MEIWSSEKQLSGRCSSDTALWSVVGASDFNPDERRTRWSNPNTAVSFSVFCFNRILLESKGGIWKTREKAGTMVQMKD